MSRNAVCYAASSSNFGRRSVSFLVATATATMTNYFIWGEMNSFQNILRSKQVDFKMSA